MKRTRNIQFGSSSYSRLGPPVHALFLLCVGISAPGCGGDDPPPPTPCETLCAAAQSCGLAGDMGLPADATACAATCASADQAVGPIDCIVASLGGDRCDQAAAQACVPRDEELPVPDHDYVSPAGPQLGFVSLQLLGCTVEGCTGPYVIEDSAGVLPAIAQYLEPRMPGAEAFVALEPGLVSEPFIVLDAATQQELFAGQDITLDPEGVYTVRELAATGNECALTGSALPVGDTAFNGQPGGICGALAIAHSLVYRLTVVEEDWAGTKDGDKWDPDFLRAIQMATGDDDGRRGITQDQVDTAHEADWNAKWKVGKSLDWTTLPNATSDADASCAELETWCNQLVQHHSDENDDCIIFLEGMDTNGQHIGHFITVTSASWDAANCRCVVEAVNTGLQDGPAHDFTGVPVDPGKHTWEFGLDADIPVTAGSSLNFWNRLFNEAHVACYDEGSRLEWPWEDLENGPGSAFPGQ